MSRKTLWVTLFFFIHGLVDSTAQQNPFPGEAELAGARAGDLILKAGSYQGRKADYGILVVPENREREGSRLIRLPVVRLRATEVQPLEPVFFLQGGPGASCLSADMPEWIHREHDFIMVGYRGVDGSVSLDIPELRTAPPAVRPLSQESLEAMGKAMCTGLERLKKEGVDLDHYSMLDVADDLEAARLALGYQKINLWSHSYGTQVAYVYCVRHPQSLHLNMVTGASAPGWAAVWEPEMVDRQLRYYAELWKKDPGCVKRSPDLIETIRKVIQTLPRNWETVTIDPDKVKVVLYNLLFNTGTAAQVFDAFATAEKGDYGGLAFLSLSFDEKLKNRLNAGDFALKILTSGDVDPARDWEKEMDPPGSIIGSPMCKINWGPLKYCPFPVRTIPRKYRNSPTAVKTLVVNGHPDFSSPLELTREKLMPLLTNGTLVVKSEMGHQDIIGMQSEAYRHLWETFFRTGKGDDSKFQYAPMNFEVSQPLALIFKEWLKKSTAK